jgi:voltage-gated potassium channel
MSIGMRFDALSFYRCWNIFITAIVTFTAVEIPAQLVLAYHAQLVTGYVDGIITLIFFTDFLFNLRRLVTAQSSLPRTPSSLTGRYGKRGLLVDLLATLPFRLMLGTTPWQLLRLVKLIHVIQFMRQWRRHEIRKAHILRLGFFVFWLGLIAHWLACGWLALRGLAPELDNASNYLKALYWCITTLATVGYGDITPATNEQMVYAMVVMIIGVGVYGYVIGNVATLLANIDLAKAHYRANLERLSTFLNYRKIPHDLQHRIYTYYTYLWENRLGYDEAAILSDLPPTLRAEVSLVLKREFIEKVPFFKGASQELIRDISLELRPVVFTPGDYIFRAGEIGRHMYFISRGTVEVVTADGQVVLATLQDGDFFGEIALLFSQPRTASIRAVDYCDLYALGKETFERIVEHYPDFAMHINDEARKRQGNSG